MYVTVCVGLCIGVWVCVSMRNVCAYLCMYFALRSFCITTPSLTISVQLCVSSVSISRKSPPHK